MRKIRIAPDLPWLNDCASRRVSYVLIVGRTEALSSGDVQSHHAKRRLNFETLPSGKGFASRRLWLN